MNVQKIYTAVRTTIIVGGIVVGTGIAWATVIAGLCRIVFKLGENEALLWIGIPAFVLYMCWGVVYLPKEMRKAGFID